MTDDITFLRGISDLAQLPPAGPPEIAFAGRSNVGKSSLINALTGRKALARTSHTPGRTQQLNFFDIGGRYTLVDMPGYGYAQVSKAERAEWDSLIRDYLRGRVTLRCAFLLVDARHGLKDSDREMLSMLAESAVPCRLVLTKSDKVKAAARMKLIDATAAELKTYTAAWPEPLLTSSHEKENIEALRDAVAALTA